ncbi:hypothetical protein R3P38DRAFT_2969746 [Favolaschia claudopus]|uniref:Ribosomal protein S15 n=1 Tax=Favolaschia claudopus TaxID=2862362 RepID=A0AAW0B443_9AGAR
MFRVCALVQPCKVEVGASSSSSGFHTSAVLSKISEARLRSRALKKANLQKRGEVLQTAQATRPSVILGTRPGEDHLWAESYLGRLVVDESVFTQPMETTTVLQNDVSTMPKYKAFGVAEGETQRLFSHLPMLTKTVRPPPIKGIPTAAAEINAKQSVYGEHDQTSDEEDNSWLLLEKQKAASFARVIDLRNADAGGISYENRRRIVLAFSTPENPFSPGRTEVQAAILTYRIRKLYAHLKRCKPDLQNKLPLRVLVHQRAKVLKYLKRTARPRYDALLKQLCILPDAVEGELIVN